MANATPPDLSNSETTAAFKQVDRTWERAWTLKEMRQGASHWSLAGDAGLLLYLQEFSQKLISRTHEIEKEVENLVHDSKLTTVRVNNVFNEFMMLANTQFVENRVYEDESDQVETQPEEKKQESQEKTREQREAELVPKVSEAIRLGVDVIERAFEKLETNIDQSDSEEDESYRVDPILEAKDPYLERSLPYLIGTPQFLNDDNVGLREVSDDDESDHGEISESEESESEEDKKKQQDSYSDSESDSDGEVPVSRPAKPMFPADASEESDSDGDLFGASERRTKPEDSSATPSEGESGEEHNTQVPAAPLDFASELARKLGGAPPKPSSPQAGTGAGDEEKGPGQKEHKKKKKEVTKPAKTEEEDLFGEAGESEDEDLFGGGTFGGKKSTGIFDDSDEGDLFGETPAPRTPATRPQDHSEAPTPVETSRGRTRTSSSGKKVPAAAVNMPSGAPGTKSSGLFDDEEEEDDIFSVSSKPKQATGPIVEKPGGKVPVTGGGLFESDSDHDDDPFKNVTKPDGDLPATAPEIKKPPEKKHPVGGVSMFGPSGAGNPLMKAIKNRVQKQDSDEDMDGSHTESVKVSQSEPRSQTESVKSNQSEPRSQTGSVKSNQSEPRSQTGNVKASQSESLKQPSKIPTVESKDSLFAEEPDDSFVPAKPKSNSVKSTKGLFDDEEEDDLFGSVQPSTEKPKQEDTKSKSKKPDLLLSDEEDLFGTGLPTAPSREMKSKPAGAVSIFPGGVDVFAKPPAQTTSARVKEVPSRPPAKSISLFDDDDSAEADLFGGPAARKPPTPTSQPAASAKKSIFDDEGAMYGDDDDGDIFSKPAVKPAATKGSTAGPLPAASLTKQTESEGSHSLFDSDSEDMFGSTQTKVSPQGQVEVAGVASSQANTEGPLSSPTPETDRPRTTSREKPPVGGVSMFGPGTLPPTLGRGKAAGGTESISKSEVVVRKPEPMKATVDPLFGDDEEEDDLFAKPIHKPTVTPAPGLTGSTSSKTHLPLNDDNQDEMVSTSPKKSDSVEPLSPVEARPRKPVGGVSMFGGVNPFPVSRATEVSRSPDKSSTSPPEDADLPKPAAAKDIKASPAKGKIGKLQATLNFNPASMLPGAVAPVKEPEPLTIGFDVPAEARTLHSANKDRAKVGVKRRPPSRATRRSAALSTDNSNPLAVETSTPEGPGSASPDIDFSRIPPPVVGSPDRVTSPEPQSRHRPDMFGNEDLFADDTPEHISRQTTSTNTRPTALSDDIFSSKTIEFPKSKTKIGDLDDLFPAQQNTTAGMGKIAEKDDDLFGSVRPTVTPSVIATPGQAAAADDDDIFAVKKSKPRPVPSPIIDEEDDIFASSSLNESKKQETRDKVENGFTGSAKKTEKKGGLGDGGLFSTDTTGSSVKPVVDGEDIFATGTKADKKKSKKAVTKDDDLFADDTDIFSDIPKAKPKEKKTKKKTSAAPSKTIFKDDIDDIFADTSAATGKVRDKKKSAKTKASQIATQPTVDDPLS